MNPWIMIGLWIVFIIVSVIIEIETADLITIWFSIGAVGALIAAAFSAPPLVQVCLFIGISVLLLLVTRKLTKNMSDKNFVRTNADRVIGSIVTVTKEVHPNEVGEVIVGSVLWRAASVSTYSFSIGEKVIVEAISGSKLIISKIDKTDLPIM